MLLFRQFPVFSTVVSYFFSVPLAFLNSPLFLNVSGVFHYYYILLYFFVFFFIFHAFLRIFPYFSVDAFFP